MSKTDVIINAKTIRNFITKYLQTNVIINIISVTLSHNR